MISHIILFRPLTLFWRAKELARYSILVPFRTSRFKNQEHEFQPQHGTHKIHPLSVKEIDRKEQFKENTRSFYKILFSASLCVGVGLVFSSYLFDKFQPPDEFYPAHEKFYIRWYRRIPLNKISQLWGEINKCNLPVWLRVPVYSTYSWIFNCDMTVVADQDFRSYNNLSEFFRRALKSDARPVCTSSCLTSPADGRVLSVGVISSEGVLEQIKGVNYSLRGFLGPYSDESIASINSKGTVLYQIVIYLAPGDYHRFHSAANWQLNYRRHFPGYLLSVNPSVAKNIPGLFSLNERVVYFGHWEYGFMAFAAVGATSVGSIIIHCDPGLMTNSAVLRSTVQTGTLPKYFQIDLREKLKLPDLQFKKGELFGEFDFGSTVVLIFEAPKDSLKILVEPGQRVLCGQGLVQITDVR